MSEKFDNEERVLEVGDIDRAIEDFHNAEKDRYKKGDIPEVLKRIESGNVTREKMVEVMTTRYQVAHFFEDMLRRIIQNVEGSELPRELKVALIHSVQENLDEELGLNPEYGGPHIEGREVLLTALGVDYENWKRDLGSYENLGNLSKASSELINTLREIIDEDPITAVAMLYYYEERISLDHMGDYYKLLAGLEALYPEFKKEKYSEGDAFWHVYSHADHDEHHAQLAKDGLLSAVKSRSDLDKVLSGMERAKKALDKFWGSLNN